MLVKKTLPEGALWRQGQAARLVAGKMPGVHAPPRTSHRRLYNNRAPLRLLGYGKTAATQALFEGRYLPPPTPTPPGHPLGRGGRYHGGHDVGQRTSGLLKRGHNPTRSDSGRPRRGCHGLWVRFPRWPNTTKPWLPHVPATALQVPLQMHVHHGLVEQLVGDFTKGHGAGDRACPLSFQSTIDVVEDAVAAPARTIGAV